uniref:Transcription factor CBF/NF-Y/archaeal histone domain-containing protein n=2 Tax=Magnoliopsida TaxID=3398 RepID=A0A0D9X7F4_9ORYZ
MDPMDIVGKSKEDVSLPKSTMFKIIKEMLPPDVRVARDAQDLLVECCVEFINLLSSESNEVCSREDKKTIAPEHVLRALQDLGFREYIEEVQMAYEQHKNDTLDSPKASKFTGIEMTEEQAVAEQQRMFAEARARMNNGSQNMKRSSKHHSRHSLICTLNHSNPCSLKFSSILNHSSPHKYSSTLNRSKLRSLNLSSTLNRSNHSCNRNLSSTCNPNYPRSCSRNLSSIRSHRSRHNLSSISNRSRNHSHRQSCNQWHNHKQNMAWTVATRTLLGGREGRRPWRVARLSRMSTSPFSHLNWMLSSSMISPHRRTNAAGISAPSAAVAELSSFPCIPTIVLNHIRRPRRPGKTRVSFLGPRIVFTPPSGSHSTSIPSALALHTHTPSIS